MAKKKKLWKRGKERKLLRTSHMKSVKEKETTHKKKEK
jgi:hypothetical protein